MKKRITPWRSPVRGQWALSSRWPAWAAGSAGKRPHLRGRLGFRVLQAVPAVLAGRGCLGLRVVPAVLVLHGCRAVLGCPGILAVQGIQVGRAVRAGPRRRDAGCRAGRRDRVGRGCRWVLGVQEGLRCLGLQGRPSLLRFPGCLVVRGCRRFLWVRAVLVVRCTGTALVWGRKHLAAWMPAVPGLRSVRAVRARRRDRRVPALPPVLEVRSCTCSIRWLDGPFARRVALR